MLNYTMQVSCRSSDSQTLCSFEGYVKAIVRLAGA